MNSSWNLDPRKYREKPAKRRVFLLLAILGVLVLGFSWKTLHALIPAIQKTDHTPGGQAEAHPIPEPDHIFTWAITPGDTLSSIFGKYEIPQKVLYQILSADESLLALDVLSPGNVLTFTLDKESRQLAVMELFVHPGQRILYKRVDNDTFEYEEIIIPGEWIQEHLDGEISGSFYASALAAGLTDHETCNVSAVFREQIRFARDIHAGDRFQVIRSRQFVEGEFTGQSRIDGIRIFRGKRVYSAFLFEDGNYYDQQGKSLARAFRRYPMKGQHRVSSHFNPARRHPVTGRITPHNGVDFAMPTGTAIVSIGDGVVTRVHRHPFAGKYVEVQHCSQYKTRYLHLSRSLVKRGQAVKRGDRIALSGNTGRSTGPHLHFELHVNGRPANPLTAKLPTASALSGDRLAKFRQQIEAVVALMEHPPEKIALYRPLPD